MKIPSLFSGRAADAGISLFVQLLPSHLTEVLVFCNLPFDTHGDLTRLLLHYLDGFLSNKRQNADLVLHYKSLAIVPVHRF